MVIDLAIRLFGFIIPEERIHQGKEVVFVFGIELLYLLNFFNHIFI